MSLTLGSVDSGASEPPAVASAGRWRLRGALESFLALCHLHKALFHERAGHLLDHFGPTSRFLGESLRTGDQVRTQRVIRVVAARRALVKAPAGRGVEAEIE